MKKIVSLRNELPDAAGVDESHSPRWIRGVIRNDKGVATLNAVQMIVVNS